MENFPTMKTFYAVLANSLFASVANTFVWFAVTFWVYLQTNSVIATSVMAGVFSTTVAFSGFFLGSLVDRYPKKAMMILSSTGTLICFVLALVVYITATPAAFTDASSITLWAFVLLCLFGAIVGNLRGIVLSTLVTILVAEDNRDKANGMVGTANGVAFLIASILSGVVIGFLGITWMLISAIVCTALIVAHLTTLTIPSSVAQAETGASATPVAQGNQGVDIRGTLAAISVVPGLLGLIFFHTFNNFLGGIFMSLMDAYGLLLVSVQVWGALWGFLSLAFIVGGVVVARRGLGKNPMKTLFVSNIIMWSICIFFTMRASIELMAVGMFVWLALIPAVEAAEQTILQKVVPPERQGRVFGFAQSVEQAASPVMSFVIGPVAQLIFIPFMTTGAGVELFGPWFGVGMDRGIALLFTVAGVIGLIVTLVAMRSRAYFALSHRYQQQPIQEEVLVAA
jgi:MFS transporter, DHA3 family, multidrug efflux protein